MRSVIIDPKSPPEPGPGSQRGAQILKLLDATGASMRLDRFRESIGPDHFDALLTGKMNARLARGYALWEAEWRRLVSVKEADDMLTNYVVRVSPLANLDRLEDHGGAFQEIDAPQDAEVPYNIAGWGNLIVADFKTLRSDRLGWFRRVSTEAGKAAARTFHKWFFQRMLQANPAVDDGNALFDQTNHGNDLDGAGTGAELNYANLPAAWERMRGQTDAHGEPIFVEPAWIACGERNESNADTLVNGDYNPDNANRERNFFKGRLKGAVVSPYLGTDWYLWADKSSIETFEVGFLDGNVDPALYMLNPDVSDTYFRTKKIMWRIEHYYGGNWIDWGGVVRGSQNV